MPFIHQALLTAEADMLSQSLGFLEAAADAAQNICGDSVLVYDPVPMPLVRLMNRERGQLLVESSDRMALHRFLVEWSSVLMKLPKPGKITWALEVDPLEA